METQKTNGNGELRAFLTAINEQIDTATKNLRTAAKSIQNFSKEKEIEEKIAISQDTPKPTHIPSISQVMEYTFIRTEELTKLTYQILDEAQRIFGE